MAALDTGTDFACYPTQEQIKNAAKPELLPGGVGRVFRLVSGQENLLQALMRRLETPRGALAAFGGDPDYGRDISDLLNQGFSPARLAAAETDIGVELEKDDRVFRADVSVTLPTATSKLTIEIRVIPKQMGPFKAILAAGEGPTLQIIQVAQGVG